MSETFVLQFQGVQEGADPKALPPGTCLLAQNCQMDKAKRLRKRGGTRRLAPAIVGGGTITTGRALFVTTEGALGMVDGSAAYVRVDDLAAWRRVDSVPPFAAVDKRPLCDSVLGVACVDLEVIGNFLVSAWMNRDTSTGMSGSSSTFTSSDIYLQVHDLRTWQLVLPPTVVAANAARPRLVAAANGTDVVVAYAAGGTLAYRVLNIPTLSMGATIGVALGTMIPFGAFDVVQGGSDWFFVYGLAAGVDRLQVARHDTTYAALGFGNYGGAIAAPQAICAAWDTAANACHIIYSDSTAGLTRLVKVPFALGAAALGPTTIEGIYKNQAFVTVVDANTLLVGWVAHTTGAPFESATVDSTTYVENPNTRRATYGVRDPGKPFAISADRFCTSVTTYITDFDNNVVEASRVVVELPLAATAGPIPTHRQLATLETMQGLLQSGVGTYLGKAARVTSLTPERVLFASPWRHADPERRNSNTSAGCNLNVLQTSGGDLYRVLQSGHARVMVSALPTAPDGHKVPPYGFATPPLIDTLADLGGGGSMAVGRYRYSACYVHIDARGVKHRSPMAPTVTIDIAAANSRCQLDIICTSLSGRESEASGYTTATNATPTHIEVWRSEVNGETLHRLTLAPLSNVVQNDAQAYSVTLIDSRSDSNIDGNSTPLNTQPQMYTEVETDDVAPPPARAGCVHRNRFVLIEASGRQVWPSKDASEDLEVAPGFNEAFVMQFARPKVAGLSLDEKLVLWGEDDIDIAHGPGPDALGSGQSWEIVRIQSDAGCISPKSIVGTPMGAVFQSRRGLQLLSRDYTVTFIGKAIEDTLADYPHITSATLCEEAHEVRFTCNDDEAAPTEGIVLAWDYLHNFWFVRRYKDLAGTASIPFADALLADGVYHLLGIDGVVYREAEGMYLDCETHWVERDVQLAPFEPSGSGLGWHRVKDCTLLTTSMGAHRLELSAAIDFAAVWSQVEAHAEGELATDIAASNKARITFEQQKCQALALRIRDLTPAAPDMSSEGEGPIFEALAFRAMTKRGPVRLANGETK